MRSSHRPGAGAPPTERADLPLGMRRLSWVRITIEATGVRAELVGMGHRLPVTRPVPLHVAAALVARGAPSVVRRHSAHRLPSERQG